tara:strand:- start:531 stop:1469 length:939 start_codon:yes stop_codon:yes gene_type:complete
MKIINRYHDELKYRFDSLRFFVRNNFTKNFLSKLSFKNDPVYLSETQDKILNSIKKKGFAKSSLNELFENEYVILEKFDENLIKLKKTKEFENALRYFEKNFNETGKTYIFRSVVNKNFKVEIDSYLINFILSDTIIDIVNSYFGMFAKLNTADLWITFLNKGKIKRTNSQRWHRDRDDVKILKIFLYLNDISVKNGATEYIPYSRKNEKYQNLAKFSYGNISPWKVYPKIEEGKEFDKNDVEKLLGNKGTIYFVDTTGMHRGGFSNESDGERIFGYWSFVSPASVFLNRNFEKPSKSDLKKFKEKQIKAIT